MKTIKILASIFLLAVCAQAQLVTLSSTTLGAAITTTNGTSLTLASTTGMQTAGPVNQVNTCLYIDKELFGVVTVVDSTHVTVTRRGGGCGAVGAGARPMTHANGATVYFVATQTIGTTTIPAPTLIAKNDQPNAETFGSCTATSEVVLPKIYQFNGDIMDCIGGLWTLVNQNFRPTLATGVTIPAGVLTPTATMMITDSGTAAMTGITVPHGAAPGFCLTIIPGGAFTWTTATNLRTAGTAVAGKIILFCWDGSKWDASI